MIRFGYMYVAVLTCFQLQLHASHLMITTNRALTTIDNDLLRAVSFLDTKSVRDSLNAGAHITSSHLLKDAQGHPIQQPSAWTLLLSAIGTDSGGLKKKIDIVGQLLTRAQQLVASEQWSSQQLKDYVNEKGGYPDFTTPLHQAVQIDAIKLVQILLDNGADWTIPDWREESAEDYARRDRQDLYELFLKTAIQRNPSLNIEEVARTQASAYLITAVKSQNSREIVSALNFDANINTVGPEGKTPLIIASSQNSAITALILLGWSGVDVTIKDRDEKTALDYPLGTFIAQALERQKQTRELPQEYVSHFGQS